MNSPVATERRSFLPLRVRSTTVVGTSSIPIPSHSTTSMPLAVQNESNSSLVVGNRVLVNGLKSGTLRYVGEVKFAQGLFCGIELDLPDGKHDGKVNDIRYFQCKMNYGIFVPHDKVLLAPRERASSVHRAISRLKPPAMTRSMTLSSPINNKIEQISIPSKSFQLPDIIPSPSIPTQPIPTTNQLKYEIITPIEQIIPPKIQSRPIIIDEPTEIIEADFTDSVSLILHQLQQEHEPFITQPRSSITISEEGTIDDDDNTDISDSESITELIINEKPIPSISIVSSTNNNSTKFVQTDLSVDRNDNLTIIKNNLLNSKLLSNSNRSLASSTTSINKLPVKPKENQTNINKRKANIPTPVPVIKKVLERKLSVPSTTNISTTSRRSSLIPPKTTVLPTTKLNSTNKLTSLGLQSKLTSSSTSVNSMHSDITSNQHKPTRGISHSIDLGLDKNSNSSRQSLDALDHQLIIQKVAIQSLEGTNEHLKKQYKHLLNQFDLMSIVNQYHITETEQIQHRYKSKFSKVRLTNNQLKNLIEQMKFSHEDEVSTLDEQYRNEIDRIQQTQKQESVEYQQQIDKLINEKIELETRCISLQEQVNRFLEEMANSDHADPLLRRVETLEKDKESLQTVLEMRNQELTQIRTKINQQVFQREDQMALQKRIDMAENRNQDLVCLLRNWQLNEKAVAVERDELKEQLAQLERDNRQLTFENETLLYRVRHRTFSLSFTPTSNLNTNSHSTQNPLRRTRSYSSLIINSHENDNLTRSLSLNYISNR